MFSRFRHRNWVRTDGRVIDTRIRTVYRPPSSMPSVGPLPLHAYVVECTAPDGKRARFEVEQSIDSVAVRAGADVPLLVSPDGTKAKLDEDDPRINVMAVHEAQRKADEERFRGHLDG